jgi:hypothetical protein
MTFTATWIATRDAQISACAPRLLTATLLVLALTPAAASACMYTPRDGDEPIFEQGERGAMMWLWGEVMESTLRPADNLGHGFVVQTSYVGAGCGGESSTIVQDCNTGAAIAFGGDGDLSNNEQWLLQLALLDDVRRSIDRGQPLAMDQIAAEASARGLEFAVPMRTNSRLLLGEMEVELGGACRAFYPRLIGSAG